MAVALPMLYQWYALWALIQCVKLTLVTISHMLSPSCLRIMGNWMLCKLSTGSTICSGLLSGDSDQEVTGLLHIPRQSASSEHPGLWGSLVWMIWWYVMIFYGPFGGLFSATWCSILRYNETVFECKALCDINTLFNIAKKRSKTATGNVTMIIQWLLQHVQNTALASHQVIGSSSATLKSIAEVNDPWPRTTTCWASILPSDQKGSESVVWWRIYNLTILYDIKYQLILYKMIVFVYLQMHDHGWSIAQLPALLQQMAQMLWVCTCLLIMSIAKAQAELPPSSGLSSAVSLQLPVVSHRSKWPLRLTPTAFWTLARKTRAPRREQESMSLRRQSLLVLYIHSSQ